MDSSIRPGKPSALVLWLLSATLTLLPAVARADAPADTPAPTDAPAPAKANAADDATAPADAAAAPGVTAAGPAVPVEPPAAARVAAPASAAAVPVAVPAPVPAAAPASAAGALVAVPADVPAAATAGGDPTVHWRLYGFLNVQLDRPAASGGATPYLGRFRVADGGSRIGFAGAVAIANQTSALWQLEGALSGFEQGGLTDQGTHTSIVSRNSYVGIENRRAGRVVAGNNDSAYRRLVGSGGDMGGNLGLSVLGLDLWNNTAAQLSSTSRSIFGRGEERYHNSVHYVSPAWHLPPAPCAGTIQVAGSYGFDDSLALGGRRDRYSVAGLYAVGGFAVAAAFDRQANTGINVDMLQHGFGLNTDAENGVATYYFEGVVSYRSRFGTYLGAGFERSNYGFFQLVPPSGDVIYATLNRGVMHQNGGMASVAQSIQKMTVMVSAGLLWSLGNSIYGAGGDYRAQQFSLGAKYAFNQRFSTYLFFSAIHNHAQQQINLGAPVYSNNLGTPQAYLAAGDSPHTAGVGALVRF